MTLNLYLIPILMAFLSNSGCVRDVPLIFLFEVLNISVVFFTSLKFRVCLYKCSPNSFFH